MVNHGDGTGEEVFNLAMEVKVSVADKFGIELEPEPRIL
jgi:UDP-N-acetylmuramate dehydrogenase